MKYIRVQWIHEHEDEPVEYLEELDDLRYEVRRIEILRSGRMIAMTRADMDAMEPLEVLPVPLVEELNEDEHGEFNAEEISADEFEGNWKRALGNI